MSLINPTRAPIWDRARAHIEIDLERPLEESVGHILATLDWLSRRHLLTLWGEFLRQATTYQVETDFWLNFGLMGPMVEPEAYEFLSLYYGRWIEVMAEGGGYSADVSTRPWSDFWIEYLDKKPSQWKTAFETREPNAGLRWLHRIAGGEDHDREDIFLLAWTKDATLTAPLRTLIPQLGGLEPQTLMTPQGTRRAATDGMVADVVATFLDESFAGLTRRAKSPQDDALVRIVLPSALRFVRDAGPEALATLTALWDWAGTARVLQNSENQRRHYFGGVLELIDSLSEPDGRMILDAAPHEVGQWSARLNDFFAGAAMPGERVVAILAARWVGNSATLELLARAESMEPVRSSPVLQDRVAEARATIALRMEG